MTQVKFPVAEWQGMSPAGVIRYVLRKMDSAGKAEFRRMIREIAEGEILPAPTPENLIAIADVALALSRGTGPDCEDEL